MFKTVLIRVDGLRAESYFELQSLTSYIEVPCMDFLDMHLEIDSTRVRTVLTDGSET